MSASVIPVIGRRSTVEIASGDPAAIPVSLPAAPVEQIRAEDVVHAEPPSRACIDAEDTLIFPALVSTSLLSVETLITAPARRQTKTLCQPELVLKSCSNAGSTDRMSNVGSTLQQGPLRPF